MTNITIVGGQTTTVTFTVEVVKGALHLVIAQLVAALAVTGGLTGGTVVISSATGFSQTVVVDVTGDMTIALLPGVYTVTYTPPAELTIV